jgi:hypothetical protein
VIPVVMVGLSMVGAVPKTKAPDPVFVLIVVPRKTRLVLKYPVRHAAQLHLNLSCYRQTGKMLPVNGLFPRASILRYVESPVGAVTVGAIVFGVAEL